MNVSEKKYTEFIGVKLTKEQYSLLCKTLNVKEKESFSIKLRNWIFEQIQETPANTIEYSLIEKGDGRTGVILYEDGRESDPLLYDGKEDAIRYVTSIGAILKKEGNI